MHPRQFGGGPPLTGEAPDTGVASSDIPFAVSAECPGLDGVAVERGDDAGTAPRSGSRADGTCGTFATDLDSSR